MYKTTARLHSNRSVQTLFICIVVLLIACKQKSSTPLKGYGFVTMLGNDTISVEHVIHEGNTVTVDGVDRFPLVKVRHTVVNLNDDGSIKHLEMDIHTPSEKQGQRDRKVVGDVANNNVHLSKTDSTGTLNRDFPTEGGMVVAHVPQMYSLYELYFAAAMKKSSASKLSTGTPVQMRQFYIDREFDRFPLGHATVTPLGGGKIEVFHDWLSGTGQAMMDTGYRMLSYSGAGTTYKVQVNRLTTPPDIKALVDRYEAKEAAEGPVKSLSVQDSTRAQIGNVVLTVHYSRPLLRGRTLLGDVIPYDRVWRTGANGATHFTTSGKIIIAGLKVPSGTYTLFSEPHTSGADLIINKQTGQWGTSYNASLDLGRVKLTSDNATPPVEQFTISIKSGDEKHGTLVLEWGTFRWSAPIEVE